MDREYKRNERCVIGLPRCDYVFNSNRMSFIAYGFESSRLEMEILKGILESKNIEVYEAGGNIDPGKNAFCSKICSKIITSQFCLVLLNNDSKDSIKVPNANVNMEYGLMLGFNKYVIPFQKDNEKLPFNVSGIDTIKYNQSNFKEKAEKAITQAIDSTKPESETKPDTNLTIEKFLLAKDAFIAPIDDEGHKNLHALGSSLNYYLLNDFTGLKYYYLGIFNLLRIEQIKWRMKKLDHIIKARFHEDSLKVKLKLGVITQFELESTKDVLKLLSSWIIVQNEQEKEIISEFSKLLTFPFKVFSLSEIENFIDEEGI